LWDKFLWIRFSYKKERMGSRFKERSLMTLLVGKRSRFKRFWMPPELVLIENPGEHYVFLGFLLVKG
jgi:hypothetical protein